MKEEDNTDICSLCLEILNKKDIFTTSCNHQFHTLCWKELLEFLIKYKKEQKCPLCNKNLNIIKILNKNEFIDLINGMINRYDIYELNENPEIALANILEYFNEKKNYNFPEIIYSKILVFEKIYKYSIFTYNYWFLVKTYKYKLVNIINNNSIVFNYKDNSKIYYKFDLDNDGKTLIYKI